MLTTSVMDAKYVMLLGLALTLFYAAADEETVIHAKPGDVPPTPGLVRRKASTLDKCAKACLVEKTINCHYFKFVNSSKTCYLSEHDNAHVTDFIDKVTRSVPAGVSPAPLQIETKQNVNTSKPEVKEEEEIKKTENVEQLQKSTKKLKSKTNKKWQADANDIKDILSGLAEANRLVHKEMKSNRKNMANISKELSNVHSGMKHIKSQLGKEKTNIAKLKQEVNDTIKKEVKAVKNITVVKEVSVQKPQKEVKPPKPEQKTTNVSAPEEVDSSKLQKKENETGVASASQKNASVGVPQVDAGGPGDEESDGKEKTDEAESKKEIKKQKKPQQNSTTKKPDGEKQKANRDKRYHTKDMHSKSAGENAFSNRQYPNNVADKSMSNSMHPNNAGQNAFSNNGYPNRGGIKRCPPGYDLHGMNCFKLIRSHLPYEEAKRMCENYKGNVLVINSKAKQYEIERFAKQNNFYAPEGLWISAIVFDSKTQLGRWDASNTEVLFDNYSSQFDYRKDPQAKRCNIFHINKNGAWDSFACSDRNRSSARLPAVCEIYANNHNAN